MDSLEWLEKSINERHINFYDYDEFINKEKTNEGGFGTIQKAEWKGYGLTVALKNLKINKNLDKLVKELQLLRSVSLHPNINLLYGLTKDPIDEHYVLILQFANEGNLREYLRKNFKELKWTDKYRIGKEISQGLLFLHNNNIVHRDLHAKNVLIHDGRAVITNFEVGKRLSDEASSYQKTDRMPEYIDPQCFIGYEYDFKSDIYSFGVILWEISSGKKPFESYRSKEAIAIHIYQGHREKRVEGTPPLYIELYERCWDNDPVNRPEMSVVLDKLAQLSSPINHRIKKGVPLNRLEDFITKQYISYHEFSEFSGLENIDLEDLGSTYEAAWRYRVIKVVLKCLKVNKNDSGKIMIQEFINKLNKLLQKIDFHQNIIELYGVTKGCLKKLQEDAQREANRCHINWFQGVIKKYKLQEIPYASLNNKKRLGRGGFETVYRAKFSSLGYVAIKEVESDTDEKAQKLFINELKQHSRTNHERIIKFYGISLDMTEKTNYLVMEYANNGNLREYLRKNELEWPEKIRLTRQIAEGISYLHEIDITHRDLHTSNILIHNKNVKISDFGFSKKLNSIAIISSKFYGAIPFIDPCKLEDQNYPYDKKSDVYSFGMLMWEISSNGRVPFNQGYDPYLPLRIIQGLREKPITVTPRQYIDLYSKCWDHEPKKRPLMEQISPQLISLQLEPKYDATD